MAEPYQFVFTPVLLDKPDLHSLFCKSAIKSLLVDFGILEMQEYRYAVHHNVSQPSLVLGALLFHAYSPEIRYEEVPLNLFCILLKRPKEIFGSKSLCSRLTVLNVIPLSVPVHCSPPANAEPMW